MSAILEFSALYRETKDLPENTETFSAILDNPVIQRLAEDCVSDASFIRYTRSPINGYIHAALKDFSVEVLEAAKEPIEFYQFPKEWFVAVSEEMAFRQYQETHTLPTILVAKSKELAKRTQTKRVDSVKIKPQWIFDTDKGTLDDESSEMVEAFLGRAWIKPDEDDYLTYLKSRDIIWWAAECGILDVVKWAYENDNSLLDESTCSYAAGKGQLHIIQWARENNGPWDEHTCAAASEGGYLSVLQWLHENGCPWDAETIDVAKNKKISKWARDNGCPDE